MGRMNEAETLRATLTEVLPALRGLSDAQASSAKPDKWSTKQVIGHLIDSASTNHQRFTRLALDDRPVFQGYAQDRWVELQDYANAPWPELLELWETFNRHLARLMDRIPSEARTRSATIGGSTPASLDFLMRDYVEHLRHHLRQIGVLAEG